jgi:hypothetical protein
MELAYQFGEGRLAAQQADRVAHAIATGIRARVKELRPQNILRARLVGRTRAVFLRTELDWSGHPTGRCSSAPSGERRRVPGRRSVATSPYLKTLESIANGGRVAARLRNRPRKGRTGNVESLPIHR